MKRFSLILCAALVASSGFSCGNKDRGDGAGHMYNAPLQGNPKSLDPQYASDPSSDTVIKNMYSGLMRRDAGGSIVCCNAEKYTVSPDGKVYTFTLRRDNYWSADKNRNDIIEENEYFPVKAEDYVFAFQRLLDPKMQSPYAEYYSCIRGGKQIISGSASPESAGVRAVDDYTLEITLEHPSAEFLNLLAASPASPCNKDFFLSTKGRYGLDDKSVMCNGAFYMRQWYYDPYGTHNILYMRKNEVNVREDYQVIPSYLSFTIQKDESGVRECLKDGSVECMTTLSSSYSRKKYSVQPQSAVTLGLIFNGEDKYFSNQNLRKALAYSVNREELADELSSDLTAASGIIPPALVLAGRSYRELASDKELDMYSPGEASELIAKAKSELKIASMDNVKILVCADTVDSGYLHLLSQSWQESLGIYIGIEDVTREEFFRRIEAKEYSIALYPLKADMDSAAAVLGEFSGSGVLSTAGSGRDYMSEVLSSTSVSEMVEHCLGAERDILSSCGFIPVFYKNTYLVADKDNEDIIYDPFSGAVDYRTARNYG